jgi:phosphoribosylformylglycinamidine synthase I
MKFGVVVFPGTWSDRDWGWVLDQVVSGAEMTYLWHKDPNLKSVDCVIVPGGFAHGDYLRTGAIARFSPIMPSIVDFASAGGLVLGSCNGFQILCEAGLLPGALIQNDVMQFRCEWANLVVERADLPFTQRFDHGQVVRIPISHGQGNYFADPATLSRIERNGQVAFRYCDAEGHVTREGNPNGSLHNIAGIVNEKGNVLGMMPHPERCAEPELGGTDGLKLIKSMLDSGMKLLTA